MINTPSIAASSIAFKGISQHEVEENGILFPDPYVHLRFTNDEGKFEKWIDKVNKAYESSAPAWEERIE